MALAGPVGFAHADFGDTFKGGCGLAMVPDITTTGSGGPIVNIDGTDNVGFIYDLSVSEEQNGLPSHATVTCWIDVNGIEQPGTRFSVSDNTVPGVEAGAQETSYAADQSSFVTECQQVSFGDGSTWVAPDGNAGTDCRPVTQAPVPIAPVIGLFDVLKQQHVDPLVCPVLVSLGQLTGGRIAGAILIDTDGDVFVAQLTGQQNNLVYDCAPYGDHFGSEPIVGNPLGGSDSLITLLLPPVL
jgi:hypothetical protein